MARYRPFTISNTTHLKMKSPTTKSIVDAANAAWDAVIRDNDIQDADKLAAEGWRAPTLIHGGVCAASQRMYQTCVRLGFEKKLVTVSNGLTTRQVAFFRPKIK